MSPTSRNGPTKQERVYQDVRERILGGTYVPGFRIVIDALAEEFGVSALPVREAIRRLEAEGLVVFRPNVGAQVAPAEPGVFDEEMSVLAVLEGYATAQAAPRIGAEELRILTEITDQMVEAMESLDTLRFGRLNHEFHHVILERCPNAALVELVNGVSRRLDAIRRTVFVQIPYRGAASVAEHRELIRLLAEPGEAGAIEAAAREHKMHTVESFRSWRAQQDADAMPLGGTARVDA
jgi:DNA-binding GntR family transcriptional regulator